MQYPTMHITRRRPLLLGRDLRDQEGPPVDHYASTPVGILFTVGGIRVVYTTKQLGVFIAEVLAPQQSRAFLWRTLNQRTPLLVVANDQN